LRDNVEAEMLLVCSTGAMEKNIETVIGSRFNKHGMSWKSNRLSSFSLAVIETSFFNLFCQPSNA